jgi:urease accessory protein
MPVITSVMGTVSDMAGTPGGEDAILLTSEERASAHMAVMTEGGRRVKISLPRGTELNDGDVLAVEDDTLIVVRAAPERLFSVAPDSARMWGVAAFHLGNLHRPVRFSADAMLTPADPKVADVLRGSGIGYDEIHAPFVGVRYGSYAGHDHDTGHDHDHAHDHDHGHDHIHDHSHDDHGRTHEHSHPHDPHGHDHSH